MSKLTKTQTEILNRIAESPFNRTTIEFGVQDWGGRKGAYGTRERNAARSLANAGTVEIRSTGAGIESRRGKFNVGYCWIVTRKNN